MAPTLPPDQPPAELSGPPGSEGDIAMAAAARLVHPTQGDDAPVSAAHTVVALARNWQAALGAMNAVGHRLSQAETAAYKILPSYPQSCRAFRDQAKERYAAAKARVQAVACEAMPPRVGAEETLWEHQCEAIKSSFDVPGLEEAFARQSSEVDDISDQILATPAQTTAEAAIKLGVFLHRSGLAGLPDDENGRHLRTLHADLERLATAAENLKRLR